MLSNSSTYGLGSLSVKTKHARQYTQEQLSDAVDRAVDLIEHYDASHGIIRSKAFSKAFPSHALANAVRQKMRLKRGEVGGGDQGYLVELRYGVWRGV